MQLYGAFILHDLAAAHPACSGHVAAWQGEVEAASWTSLQQVVGADIKLNHFDAPRRPSPEPPRSRKSRESVRVRRTGLAQRPAGTAAHFGIGANTEGSELDADLEWQVHLPVNADFALARKCRLRRGP
jgi:hypothetical protein